MAAFISFLDRPRLRSLTRALSVATILSCALAPLVSTGAPAVAAPAPKAPPVAPDATEAKAAPQLPGSVAGDYRIAPRDLVQFQIFDEPDLLSVQRVSESGEIGVPMLATFHVGGLTLREAERAMIEAYIQGGFFVKPQVILSVQTYGPRTVSVLGQVNKPDQLDFPVERDLMSIVQAITRAGGFTRVAKTDAVKVVRTTNGKEEQFIVNMGAFLDSSTGTEFMLQPDDVVYVPERVF
jgi:polysaccharide export outer membrane protein